MTSLPAGTVTFLFTDIEGSTKLLHEVGESAYAEALAEHRRVLRRAFADHGGVEVDTQGDAFFVAFATAPAALTAAAEGQAALGLRVRMGIHTGTPLLTDEGYVGADVHRAARIAAAGHGGQILVSATTATLAREGLRELGEYRLKDLSAPERLFQVGDEDFPPPKTLYRSNLPVPATPFFGRERELVEVGELLGREEVRLLTLTGPGGTGKTRLGLQAAAAASDRYPDGVFWVPLASLRDPGLVLEHAAQALGAKSGLAEHVQDKRLLLLLDNFEHVIDAADELADLQRACPCLDLLVTSRELLSLPGEQAYPLAPLDPGEGTALFIARARAANPDFSPDGAEPELCARLDNLPLALELAAARVRILSPAQLLERLTGRLDLLRAGRGVDPRHQTLRATIEWSHELLDREEQRLFSHLTVFSGGCTVDAAEAVCDADLDTLQSLVDKSLVRHTNDRFWMLETIRDYALEQLRAHPQPELPGRHADYFLRLAEEAAPGLESAQQRELLQRLEQDMPNFRAALGHFHAAGAADEGLRLASALRLLWVKLGYLSEGRRVAELLLSLGGDATGARARALSTTALLAALQGDWNATMQWSEEGRKLAEALGEHTAAGGCMLTLGRAILALGDRPRALDLFRQAAALARSIDDRNLAAAAALNLGYAALEAGDILEARAEFETATGATDPYLVARAHAAAGSTALHASDPERAERSLRTSLEVLLKLGQHEDTAAWALELYAAAIVESDPERAAGLLGAAERMREELGIAQHGMELELHEHAVAAARSVLGPAAFDAAWSAGSTHSRVAAIAAAVGA